MTVTIAVSCQMGGSGKTTTSINLAGALGSENRGRDVLLVDMDPQGAATEGTGFEDRYRADVPSLYEVLTDIDREDEINDIIQSHQEMDVIPAHEQLFGLEQEIQNLPKTEERLEGALDAITHDYDYIVIDTPPHLGPIANNSLVAAGNLVVPVNPVRRSIRALETLFEQVRIIEKHYRDIERLGLVVNDVQYPTDNDTEYMLDWFDDFADKIPIYHVRNRVALKRAWNSGVSIFAHEEECDMEAVYDELAGDIEAKVQEEVSA